MSLIITENYYEKYHDKDGAQTIIFNTPGGQNWTVPSTCKYINICCVQGGQGGYKGGTGGSGASGSGANGGAGGGRASGGAGGAGGYMKTVNNIEVITNFNEEKFLFVK